MQKSQTLFWFNLREYIKPLISVPGASLACGRSVSLLTALKATEKLVFGNFELWIGAKGEDS
jgi:hypothetical protein